MYIFIAGLLGFIIGVICENQRAGNLVDKLALDIEKLEEKINANRSQCR